jgi:MFS family permease
MAQDRRARIATAALFLTNGAIFANLLPHYPEIKADLHLSNAVYGAAIAAFSGGALVAGLAAAALIRRFHSSRVAVVGTIGIATFVVVAGLATSPRSSSRVPRTRSPTSRRTRTAFGCSAATAGRSSTRSTRYGRSARFSAV